MIRTVLKIFILKNFTFENTLDKDDDDLYLNTIIFYATTLWGHMKKKENYMLCKYNLNLKIESDIYIITSK